MADNRERARKLARDVLAQTFGVILTEHERRATDIIMEGLDAALSRGSAWRPIADAPRDGSWVLIAADEVYVARYDAINELWYFPVDGCAVDPTHWMPRPALPDPPAALAAIPAPPAGARAERGEATASPSPPAALADTPSSD